MWCRALLTATLLAYLLCVLILSGLQKEDLDVALLRKLVRHNINVDYLDNPSLRKDCLTFDNKTKSRRKANEENKTFENLTAVNTTLDVAEKEYDVGPAKDTKSVTNLLKLIKSVKPEKIKTMDKKENNESKPSSSNVVQLLLTPTSPKLNNVDTNSTNYLSVLIKRLMAQSTSTHTPTTPPTTTTFPITKTTQLLLTTTSPKSNNVDTNSMDYLSVLIKRLMAQSTSTHTPTTPPTTTTFPITKTTQLLLKTTSPKSNNVDTNSMDYLSVLIKRLMAQSTSTHTPTTPPTTTTFPITKTTQFDLASLMKDIKYMIESRNRNEATTSKQNNPNKMNGDIKLNQKKKDASDEKINSEPAFFKPSRSTTKSVPKQMSLDDIPPDIIKDIAESVKALVLQDLKKDMSTMKSIVSNTTSIPTTDRDSVLIKDATIAFAEFVQLFQHLKTTLTPISDGNITAQRKQQTMRALMNPLTASLTTLATGNLIKNSLQNLNSELESIPIYKNSINRIEQVNIFNHRNDVSPPITIQSNVNQIAPLTIPVIDSPMKMVYQNIIVTSESPFDYFKNIHKNEVHMGNTRTVYNDNKRYTNKIKAPALSDIEIIRDYNSAPRSTYHNSIKIEGYGHPRHQYGRDYHFERFRTPSYEDNYIEYNHRTSYPSHVLRDTRSRNNKQERFHEKLERADDWSPLSSERNINKFPVGSRHVLPLNNRKRQKYDDTHFKNFLKTQQKVNDMLERILATKAVSEGRRMVETL